MQSPMRASQAVLALLCCPICHSKLGQTEQQFVCTNSECDTHFPIVHGIPVLLNEQASVFSFHDFVSHQETYVRDTHEQTLKKMIYRFIPENSKNIKGSENISRFGHLLLTQSSTPRVLVLGGSILGHGMESLTVNTALEIVETDVSFGPRTMLICDAHDIPFEDGSFDGVIVQAVLEHVVDPYRCVAEIHRVLNAHGVVYAETPFMQQVHGGRYDFTRFTHLGHRRLFRWFGEIDSGAVCGPAMALVWSYEYFLLSFTTSRQLRALASAFARLTSFYLMFLDRYLINKPGTLDAASGYYFMGRKEEHALTDRELIKLYRGALS